MAGTYKTFMVDPLGALPAGLGDSIKLQLAQLFKTIVTANKFFTDNVVMFDPMSAAPSAHELLVYFMPSGLSIVKQVPSPVDLTTDGNTVYTAGASEVYVKSNDPVLLAKLAFHELMHNRLKQGDGPLHSQGGLAAASITPSSALNARNIQTMSDALQKPITQWTPGISILNNGKHDPLSEYYKI